MADDWVLVKGATRPIETLSTSAFPCPDVCRSLRIYRLIRRFSAAVGNDPATPSGQVSAEARRPLLSMFAAELSDLESVLKPTKDSDKDDRIAPAVAVRLLEAKLQLYAFMLQDDAAGATPEDLLICHTSSVRIVGLMAELHKAPHTRAMFWPRSIYGNFLAASVRAWPHSARAGADVRSQLCLLKLAGIQAASPRRLQVDRVVILQEIAVAYDVMKVRRASPTLHVLTRAMQDRSVCPRDPPDRRARAIKFLASRLQNGAVPATPGASVRSRMSLGGLLYDAIIQLKAMRITELSARSEEEGGEEGGPAIVKLTATQLLAEMQPTAPANTHPNAGAQPAMVMNGSHHVPNEWETHAAALDMSTVPSLDSPEWLRRVTFLPRRIRRLTLSCRMMSVDNCAEMMSVPDFDTTMLMPWDMDVPMMDLFAPFTS
jgi:hypothetical protein